MVVLTFNTFDGETWSKGLVATRRRVSGDIKGALVPLGIVRRLIGGGAVSSMSPEEYGAVINPIAMGVGVTGGRIGFVDRCLFGVDGPASENSAGTFFLFLLIFATLTGGLVAASSLMIGVALKRADLLEDIVTDLEYETGVNADLQNPRAGRFCSLGSERIMVAVD